VYQREGSPTLAYHSALTTGCINVIFTWSCGARSYLLNDKFFVPFEAKCIEDLLPLGLDNDELHFNKRPEYSYFN
jgi:hypothetical protein